MLIRAQSRSRIVVAVVAATLVIVLTQGVARAADAGFTWAPASPEAGAPVSFSATQQPSPNPVDVETWAWDFESDGIVDSAAPNPQHVFPSGGTWDVTLTVIDQAGPATQTHQLAVAAPPAPPAPPVTVTAPPAPPVTVTAAAPGPGTAPQPTPAVLMSPFPTVRLRGTVGVGWSRIDLLQIRAPGGSTVRVRCQGTGCPYATRSTRVRARSQTVRFHSMQRRLRAGAVVRVEVTASPARRLIGKYTSFMMRRGAAPLRRDRCIAPGAAGPTACPPTQTSASDLLMAPFPVVRMRGTRTRGRWSWVRLLTVRAPKDALVRIRCDGPRCPYRAKAIVLTRARTVRFAALEQRYRAGTAIRIYVTARGREPRIGKYTSFVMRRGASPLRRDRCLRPGTTTVSRCPT